MKKLHPKKNNVLLVNITRLGDMLQATPAIAGLKMENPSCKITVLVEKQFESICHWLPNIDEVMSIDLGMTVRSLAHGNDRVLDAYEYIQDLVTDLRSRNFDYCLNMSSSAYTALLLRLVGAENHGGWMADDEGYRVIQSDWAKLFATSVFHQNRRYNSINLVDVFRCSADVEDHPQQLLINIDEGARSYCENLLTEANFTNNGPLVAVQAGASQEKRQWAPSNFVRMISILTQEFNARVVLTGTKKELAIIDPIKRQCPSSNVFVAAGRTDIPQLAALLNMSDVLITGDTGPMHISVAAGTPVVAMFLASAFGYETGPYGEGNLVLQPVLACGPCNPNKKCSRPICHDLISPELVAKLAIMRAKSDVNSLPEEFVAPTNCIIYRSFFDDFGFCDLVALNSNVRDPYDKYRQAYRRLWLDDLGGYGSDLDLHSRQQRAGFQAYRLPGLEQVGADARLGVELIDQLVGLIRDSAAGGSELRLVNDQLTQLDRRIEESGYHFSHLGPITRMFIFAKENISGTDPESLASQMRENYQALDRRCSKLQAHYQAIS